MYVHGEMLFPDYDAIALLTATIVFLFSCVLYGFFDIAGFRLKFSLNKFMFGGQQKKVLSTRLSLLEIK